MDSPDQGSVQRISRLRICSCHAEGGRPGDLWDRADRLQAGGVKSVKIPAQSPNCNPHAERFVKTIKYECLNHFVIFGERHVRRLINEFVQHYMTERFHQGLGGQLIRKQVGPTNDNSAAGKVVRRSRLGGMLNYYSDRKSVV